MSVLSAIWISRAPTAAFVVVGLYWGAFAAYVPDIKDRIGANDAEFGLALMGSAFGLVSAMWLAPKVDRILGSRGMQVGAVVLGAFFVLPALATDPWTFALAMAVAGAASGWTDVVMNARVSDLEAHHRRALMNANHGMFSLGYAVSALVAGSARAAEWSPAAWFAMIGIATLVLITMMRMAPAQGPQVEETGAPKMPLGPILLTGVIVMIAFMAEAGMESWSALHVERTLGGSASEGALGPAMLGLTMAVGRFSGAAVAERLNDITIVMSGAALGVLGAVMAAMAQVPIVAYLGFGILGLGVAAIGPIGIAMAGQMATPEERTRAVSRAAVIGFAGFFIAPTAMGLVSETFGLRAAFAGIAIMVSALFVLTPLAAARRRAILAARASNSERDPHAETPLRSS